MMMMINVILMCLVSCNERPKKRTINGRRQSIREILEWIDDGALSFSSFYHFSRCISFQSTYYVSTHRLDMEKKCIIDEY